MAEPFATSPNPRSGFVQWITAFTPCLVVAFLNAYLPGVWSSDSEANLDVCIPATVHAEDPDVLFAIRPGRGHSWLAGRRRSRSSMCKKSRSLRGRSRRSVRPHHAKTRATSERPAVRRRSRRSRTLKRSKSSRHKSRRKRVHHHRRTRSLSSHAALPLPDDQTPPDLAVDTCGGVAPVLPPDAPKKSLLLNNPRQLIVELRTPNFKLELPEEPPAKFTLKELLGGGEASNAPVEGPEAQDAIDGSGLVPRVADVRDERPLRTTGAGVVEPAEDQQEEMRAKAGEWRTRATIMLRDVWSNVGSPFPYTGTLEVFAKELAARLAPKMKRLSPDEQHNVFSDRKWFEKLLENQFLDFQDMKGKFSDNQLAVTDLAVQLYAAALNAEDSGYVERFNEVFPKREAYCIVQMCKQRIDAVLQKIGLDKDSDKLKLLGGIWDHPQLSHDELRSIVANQDSATPKVQTTVEKKTLARVGSAILAFYGALREYHTKSYEEDYEFTNPCGTIAALADVDLGIKRYRHMCPYGDGVFVV